MFSSSGRKDSLHNAEETGVFTASLVSRDLVEQMNAVVGGGHYGVDEFALAGADARRRASWSMRPMSARPMPRSNAG